MHDVLLQQLLAQLRGALRLAWNAMPRQPARDEIGQRRILDFGSMTAQMWSDVRFTS